MSIEDKRNALIECVRSYLPLLHEEHDNDGPYKRLHDALVELEMAEAREVDWAPRTQARKHKRKRPKDDHPWRASMPRSPTRNG